jgi:hypothetical protein
MQAQSNSVAIKKRLFIAGVIVLLIGTIMFGSAVLAKARVSATSTWPSVTGRVITSEMSTATVKTGKVARSEPVAKIEYRYAVEGRQYECDRLRVIPMLHSSAPAPQETLDRYGVGHSVTVYYNPNDPIDALLTPEPASDAMNMIATLSFLGPFIAFIGMGMMFVRIRGLLPKSQPKLTREADVSVPLQPATGTNQRPRKTHWLVRTLATSGGVVVSLFGGLVCLGSILMLGDETNRHAAHYVVLVLFIAVTIAGGFLIRFGAMKRANPV